MKVIFITAHPYLPQMFGGLQTSTDEVCKNLIKRGHNVAVLCSLMPNGKLGFASRMKIKINKSLFGIAATRDLIMGYPVWRAWFPWLAVSEVIIREKPDLIVVLAMQPVKMALAAQPSGIPLLIELHDVEFSQHGGNFEYLGNIQAVANSQFTAKTYRDAYGIDPVIIYPFINSDKYRTETTRENVTFINPHKYKGIRIALEIARQCPDIPFTFVESWPLKEEERNQINADLSILPNVILLKPQKDMRNVYCKCKILLVPSLWNEGYGRVVTEAQFSGIPVIASSRGGLPEAVGPGGILVDPEGPIDNWVIAVRRLWQDNGTYNEMSAAALAYAERPEMGIKHHIDAWEKAADNAIKGQL